MKVGATRPGRRAFPARFVGRFACAKKVRKSEKVDIVKKFHVTVVVDFLVHLDQNGPA